MKKIEELNIYEKYNFFKLHIGMFISNPTYNEVVALLHGMDFAANNILLEGFSEWVNIKFDIQTPFGWSSLIKYIYTDEINSIFKLDVLILDKKESDISFLFSLIDEFLSKNVPRKCNN